MPDNNTYLHRELGLTARNNFIGARMLAVELAPYLASAIFRLTPVSTQNINTVAVDRWWRMYIDFNVFDRWSFYERALAIIHEVSHLIRDHAQRCEDLGASASLFNVAADAEINDDLNCFETSSVAGEAYQGVPDHWVLPARLYPPAEDGKLAEFYYKHIAAEQAPQNSEDERPALQQARSDEKGVESDFNNPKNDCGSGADGAERAWELGEDNQVFDKVDDASAKLIRRQVAEDVLQHQKSQSFVPEGIVKWAVRVVEQPSIHWRKVLAGKIKRSIANKAGQVDYSFQRPGRRRVPSIITPAMRHPVPTIAVILDTSASMSQSDLSVALTEIKGISRQVGVRGQNLRLLQVDTDVCQIKDIYDVNKIECHGGGGTDLRVGFRAAKSLKPSPNIIIALTDGYTPWPGKIEGANVIVGLISETDPTDAILNAIPAWATKIHICSRRD